MFKTSYTDFIFTANEFHGPVVDSRGRVIYSLDEDTGLLGGSISVTITRGDGSLVGEFRWRSLFWGPTRMSINGSRVDKLFTKTHKGLFCHTHYNFMDDKGNYLYWKNLTVKHERWICDVD